MRLRFYPARTAMVRAVRPGLAFASGRRWHKKGLRIRSSKPHWFRRQQICPPPCVVPCPAPQLIPAARGPTARQRARQGARQGRRPAAAGGRATDPGAIPVAASLGDARRDDRLCAEHYRDLGGFTRSASFPYLRATGAVNVFTFGSASALNPSIAENNSPVPRDRAYFRFNYFDNAQSVTGLGPATTFTPSGIGTASPATKFYSVEQYTFGFEKTFLNQRASLEMRVPFSERVIAAPVFSAPATSAGRFQGPIRTVTRSSPSAPRRATRSAAPPRNGATST